MASRPGLQGMAGMLIAGSELNAGMITTMVRPNLPKWKNELVTGQYTLEYNF